MANSTWTEATAGALAGLLYGVILWLLAVGVIGGGHGTVIPWFLSFGPFVLLFPGEVTAYGAPLIWVAYGYLIAVSHRSDRFRTRAIWVLLLHTVFGLAIGFFIAWREPENLTRMSGEVPIWWAAVYLAGQGCWNYLKETGCVADYRPTL